MKATTAIGISAAAVLCLALSLAPAPAAQIKLDDLAKDWSYPGARIQGTSAGSGGGISRGVRSGSSVRMQSFTVDATPETVWKFYSGKAAAPFPTGIKTEWAKGGVSAGGGNSGSVAASTTGKAGTIWCLTREYTASVMVTPQDGGGTSVSLLLHSTE